MVGYGWLLADINPHGKCRSGTFVFDTNKYTNGFLNQHMVSWFQHPEIWQVLGNYSGHLCVCARVTGRAEHPFPLGKATDHVLLVAKPEAMLNSP